MSSLESESPAQQPPRWTPLPATERRILGVLVEKAKTTPEQYPLSLNALTNGCNQKSNRHPQMNLTQEQVEESLEKLRAVGAVSEVVGGSRVAKYRHYLKDWLGVDGPELAVMAELLLRGTQTVGELRGRAARMAPIADVSALRPILADLIEKKLVIALSPEGRGQTVTHGLYLDTEMAKIKQGADFSHQAPVRQPQPPQSTDSPSSARSAPPATQPAATNAPASSPVDPNALADLKNQLAELRDKVARMQGEIDDLWKNLR